MERDVDCVYEPRCLGLAWLVACFLAAYLTDLGVGYAEIVRFRLSGIATIEDEFVLPASVTTGAPFTAYWSYDASIPDRLLDDPHRGSYVVGSSSSEFELSLQIGSMQIRNAPGVNARVDVYDDAELIPGLSQPSDSLLLSVASVGGPDSFNSTISLNLFSSQLAAWSSDALPTNIDSAAWENAFVFATGGAIRERFYLIRGEVREISLIPEPESLPMLLCGVVALRRRLRIR